MSSSEISLHLSGNSLLISFEYDPKDSVSQTIKERVKQIPGCRFNKQLSRWECSIAQYDSVVNLLDNLKISTGVMQRIGEMTEKKRRVEELKKAPYFEIEDYTSKLPLYSHQKKQFELHRILPASGVWSEMGSGKTASAICAVHWRFLMKQIERCLVVCPLNVVSNWKDELSKFSDLTYTDLIGTKEQRFKKLDLNRQVYIINYEGLRITVEELLEKGFDLVLLDEAHKTQNSEAKQSVAAYRLGDAAKYRIALTGTPTTGSLEGIFGVYRFLDSSIFGNSFYAFRNKFFINVSPASSMFKIFVPRSGADEKISKLGEQCTFRVSKLQCLDLPALTILPDRKVFFTPELDRAYETLQKECFIELAEQEKLKISHFLTVLMKLNQVSSGFFKIPGSNQIVEFDPNPKFEELKEIVDSLPGEPIVIWAFYIHDIEMIHDYYSRCIKCKKYTNDVIGVDCPGCGTPIKHRSSCVYGKTKNKFFEVSAFRFTPEERSQKRLKMKSDGLPEKEIKSEIGEPLSTGEEAPQRDIFVAQISSASEGISLVRSAYAIYYSRSYSWKDYVQSQARTHRSGQLRNVSYLNLVSCRENGDDTIDQKMLQILKKKEGVATKFNKDDIRFIMEGTKKDREALKIIEILDKDGVVEEDVEISNIAEIAQASQVTKDASFKTELFA